MWTRTCGTNSSGSVIAPSAWAARQSPGFLSVPCAALRICSFKSVRRRPLAPSTMCRNTWQIALCSTLFISPYSANGFPESAGLRAAPAWPMAIHRLPVDAATPDRRQASLNEAQLATRSAISRARASVSVVRRPGWVGTGAAGTAGAVPRGAAFLRRPLVFGRRVGIGPQVVTVGRFQSPLNAAASIGLRPNPRTESPTCCRRTILSAPSHACSLASASPGRGCGIP